ncbi:MAG TPA: SatD family protein [Actinomycetota bacterium]|nr:SatD family protein [Actinomycetota bacterium]
MDRVVALLGDVVRSRAQSEPGIGDRLLAALALANDRLPAIQPLIPTIGDEFQGLYGDVVSALDATPLVRLALLGELDVRFGIGSGELTTFDEARAPFGQDGPAWWVAREAVDTVRAGEQKRERSAGLRTRWIDAAGDRAPAVAAVNAFLSCRDELVAAMDPRDAATLLGLLADRPVVAIAASEGVSPSAISQRAIRGGLYAIRAAHRELRDALG